jgi:UDP-glucose 4-epimerase
LNVLCAARDAEVKRVVIASSSSVYGNTEVLPKVETMVTAPLSPYAVSKLAAEQYGVAFYRSFGLETVALRYFNVFGPRQDPTSQYAAVIPRFLEMIKRSERPTVYGDGEQSRDFTYVDNVVNANLLACVAKDVGGEVFNCACFARVSLNQLMEKINALLGKAVEPVYTPPRPGDVKHSLADIRKARALLGYTVKVPFEAGLTRLISASLSHTGNN